jgi:hypothetical protein
VSDTSADATKPADDDGDTPDGLFFGVSAARMRSRARWCSVLLLLVSVLPLDVLYKTPIFLWDVLPEVSLGGQLGLLALPIAAASIFVASLVTKRGGSLGMFVLAALASAALLRWLGAERAAWDSNTLPEGISNKPAFVLLSLSAAAAAGNLSFRPATKRAVLPVVSVSVVSALVYYVLPDRGEAPLHAIFRTLAHISELPDVRFQIGALILTFLVSWPLAVAISSLLLLRSPSSKDEGTVALLATWGLPVWLGLLIVRGFGSPEGGLVLLLHSAMVLAVTAVVGLCSAALLVAVETFFVREGDVAPASRKISDSIDGEVDAFGKAVPSATLAPTGGLPARVALVASIGATLAFAGVAFALSRPPEKGTDWTLREASPKSDEVFGTALPSWMRARRDWDLATRAEQSAEARVLLKERGKSLTVGAAELDPALGDAMKRLVEESDDLDLAGRRWGNLVTDVNEASRRAGLPYYLDADIVTELDKDSFRHSFAVFPYRIEEVRQYDVGGRPYATLRVRRVGRVRQGHGRLGFSRDSQPFALVILEETEEQGEIFSAISKLGYCTDGLVANSELYSGLDRCGQLLKEYAAGDERAVASGVLVATERHELQHQIDGPHVPLSPAVLAIMDGYAHSSQDRVNREVSAFLAELTAEGAAPKVTLVQLAQYLLAREDPTGTYGKTAMAAFEALSGRSVRRGYRLDGKSFWSVYEELFKLPDDELRALAKTTWERECDAELVTPKLR